MNEDPSKCRDKLCSWSRRFNIADISVMLKSIYGFNTVPIKVIRSTLLRRLLVTPRFGEGMVCGERSYTVQGNAGWCSHCGKQLVSFL